MAGDAILHGHPRRHRDLAPAIAAEIVDGDPLGVDEFATHHLPLEDAPAAYAAFQKKEQGMQKVVFRP